MGSFCATSKLSIRSAGTSRASLLQRVTLHQMYFFNSAPLDKHDDIYLDRNQMKEIMKKFGGETARIISIDDALKVFDLTVLDESTTQALITVHSRDVKEFNRHVFGWDRWKERWVIHNGNWMYEETVPTTLTPAQMAEMQQYGIL